jgi:lipopolysaccharide export system protein LptA
MKKSKQSYFSSGLLYLFILAFLVNPSTKAMCAEKTRNPATPTAIKNDSPVHVASDRMEVKYKDNVILFEGHVIVKQDNLTITGNRMTVYITQPPKKESTNGSEKDLSKENMADRIDRIEVEGDVKISQEDKIATADKSIYYQKEQKIVLMGHPTVSQGKDVLRGRLITLYLSEERSVVEGGQEAPVEAVLYPSRKE